MRVGSKRTTVGRIGAVLGLACGVIGLLAGLTDHTRKMWPFGWFAGGTVQTLIALFILLDGAIAFQNSGS